MRNRRFRNANTEGSYFQKEIAKSAKTKEVLKKAGMAISLMRPRLMERSEHKSYGRINPESRRSRGEGYFYRLPKRLLRTITILTLITFLTQNLTCLPSDLSSEALAQEEATTLNRSTILAKEGAYTADTLAPTGIDKNETFDQVWDEMWDRHHEENGGPQGPDDNDGGGVVSDQQMREYFVNTRSAWELIKYLEFTGYYEQVQTIREVLSDFPTEENLAKLDEFNSLLAILNTFQEFEIEIRDVDVNNLAIILRRTVREGGNEFILDMMDEENNRYRRVRFTRYAGGEYLRRVEHSGPGYQIEPLDLAGGLGRFEAVQVNLSEDRHLVVSMRELTHRAHQVIGDESYARAYQDPRNIVPLEEYGRTSDSIQERFADWYFAPQPLESFGPVYRKIVVLFRRIWVKNIWRALVPKDKRRLREFALARERATLRFEMLHTLGLIIFASSVVMLVLEAHYALAVISVALSVIEVAAVMHQRHSRAKYYARRLRKGNVRERWSSYVKELMSDDSPGDAILKDAAFDLMGLGSNGTHIGIKLLYLYKDRSEASPDGVPIVKSRVNLVRVEPDEESRDVAAAHAGGMGINILHPDVLGLRGETARRHIRKKLIHEAIVGLVSGDPEKAHRFADAVVDALESGDSQRAEDLLSNLDDGLVLRDRALWELTEAERKALVRDYRAEDGWARRIEPETREQIVEDAIKTIDQGQKQIQAGVAQVVMALPPAPTPRTQGIPERFWDAYYDLFGRVCSEPAAQEINELRELGAQLAGPVTSGAAAEGAIESTLGSLFFEEGKLLLFQAEHTPHNNWLVTGVPSVSVDEINDTFTASVDVMGESVPITAVLLGNANVTGACGRYTVAFYLERTLAAIPGPAPVFVYEDQVDKELRQLYQARLHIARYNVLPPSTEDRRFMQTGDPLVDDALKELLVKQWQAGEFEEFNVPIDEDETDAENRFVAQYYYGYMEYYIEHEGTHIGVKTMVPREQSEIFTYLRDIAKSRYRWVRLYGAVECIVPARRALMQPDHLTAADFFLGQALPAMVQSADPSLQPSRSPEYMRAFLQAVPNLPVPLLDSACSRAFIGLRTRLAGRMPPGAPGAQNQSLAKIPGVTTEGGKERVVGGEARGHIRDGWAVAWNVKNVDTVLQILDKSGDLSDKECNQLLGLLFPKKLLGLTGGVPEETRGRLMANLSSPARRKELADAIRRQRDAISDITRNPRDYRAQFKPNYRVRAARAIQGDKETQTPALTTRTFVTSFSEEGYFATTQALGHGSREDNTVCMHVNGISGLETEGLGLVMLHEHMDAIRPKGHEEDISDDVFDTQIRTPWRRMLVAHGVEEAVTPVAAARPAPEERLVLEGTAKGRAVVEMLVERIKQRTPALNAEVKSMVDAAAREAVSATEPLPPCAIPPQLWKGYLDIFREVCETAIARDVPELTLMRTRLQQRKPLDDESMGPLIQLFLESNKLIVFYGHDMRLSGRQISHIPILAVHETGEPRVEPVDVVGQRVDMLGIHTTGQVVKDCLESLPVGATFTGVTIQGKAPYVIFKEGLENHLGGYYTTLEYIYDPANDGQLPANVRTADADFNEALKALICRQWPREEFAKFKSREAFIDAHRPGFIEDMTGHEAVHRVVDPRVPKTISEVFTFLFDMANARYCWARLYDILRELPPTPQGVQEKHAMGAGVIFLQVLPDIVRTKGPGGLPGISAAECRAATEGDVMSCLKGLFKIVHRLPDDVAVDECNSRFAQLRRRGPATAGARAPAGVSMPSRQDFLTMVRRDAPQLTLEGLGELLDVVLPRVLTLEPEQVLPAIRSDPRFSFITPRLLTVLVKYYMLEKRIGGPRGPGAIVRDIPDDRIDRHIRDNWDEFTLDSTTRSAVTRRHNARRARLRRLADSVAGTLDEPRRDALRDAILGAIQAARDDLSGEGDIPLTQFPILIDDREHYTLGFAALEPVTPDGPRYLAYGQEVLERVLAHSNPAVRQSYYFHEPLCAHLRQIQGLTREQAHQLARLIHIVMFGRGDITNIDMDILINQVFVRGNTDVLDDELTLVLRGVIGDAAPAVDHRERFEIPEPNTVRVVSKEGRDGYRTTALPEGEIIVAIEVEQNEVGIFAGDLLHKLREAGNEVQVLSSEQATSGKLNSIDPGMVLVPHSSDVRPEAQEARNEAVHILQQLSNGTGRSRFVCEYESIGIANRANLIFPMSGEEKNKRSTAIDCYESQSGFGFKKASESECKADMIKARRLFGPRLRGEYAELFTIATLRKGKVLPDEGVVYVLGETELPEGMPGVQIRPMPYPKDGTAIFIAPHSDDTELGAAGIQMVLASEGNDVYTCIAVTGQRVDILGRVDANGQVILDDECEDLPEDVKARLREDETARAAKFMGTQPQFWHLPFYDHPKDSAGECVITDEDREIVYENLEERYSAHVESAKPGPFMVFLPHEEDMHHTHRAVSRLGMEAVERLSRVKEAEITVVFYKTPSSGDYNLYNYVSSEGYGRKEQTLDIEADLLGAMSECSESNAVKGAAYASVGGSRARPPQEISAHAEKFHVFKIEPSASSTPTAPRAIARGIDEEGESRGDSRQGPSNLGTAGTYNEEFHGYVNDFIRTYIGDAIEIVIQGNEITNADQLPSEIDGIVWNLGMHLREYPLQTPEPVHLFLFDVDRKDPRFGDYPYAMVDREVSGESEEVYAHTGTGGDATEGKRRSVYAQRRLVEALLHEPNQGFLELLLPDEVREADDRVMARDAGDEPTGETFDEAKAERIATIEEIIDDFERAEEAELGYAASLKALVAEEEETEVQDATRPLLDLAAELTGLRPALLDSDEGLEWFSRRLSEEGIVDQSEYLASITEDGRIRPEHRQEAEAFFNGLLLSIPDNFFPSSFLRTSLDRHHGAYNYFATEILPSMLTQKARAGKKRLSLKVIGLSTGEEAASLYYYVRRTFESHEERGEWGNIDDWEIEIHGIDVCEYAVGKARRRLLDVPRALRLSPTAPANGRDMRETMAATPREVRTRVFRFTHGNIAYEPVRRSFLEEADAVFANVTFGYISTHLKVGVIEDLLNTPAWLFTDYTGVYEVCAGRRETVEILGKEDLIAAPRDLHYAIAPQGEQSPLQRLELPKESLLLEIVGEQIDLTGSSLPTYGYLRTGELRPDYDRDAHMDALVEALQGGRMQLPPYAILMFEFSLDEETVPQVTRGHAARLLEAHAEGEIRRALAERPFTENGSAPYIRDVRAATETLYGDELHQKAPPDHKPRYIITTEETVPAGQQSLARGRLMKFLRENRGTELIIVRDIDELNERLDGDDYQSDNTALILSSGELTRLREDRRFRTVAVSSQDGAPIPLAGLAAYADKLLDLDSSNADQLVPELERQFRSLVGGEPQIRASQRLQARLSSFVNPAAFVEQLNENPIGFARRMSVILPPAERVDFNAIMENFNEEDRKFLESA